MKRGESGWRQSLLFSLNHIKMVFVCRSHSCVDVWLRPLLRHALTWWAVMTMSVTHRWWVTGKRGILKLNLSIHSAAPLGGLGTATGASQETVILYSHRVPWKHLGQGLSCRGISLLIGHKAAVDLLNKPRRKRRGTACPRGTMYSQWRDPGNIWLEMFAFKCLDSERGHNWARPWAVTHVHVPSLSGI